jgi:hypothetical protein
MKAKALIALVVPEEYNPAAARMKEPGPDSSKGETCTFNG